MMKYSILLKMLSIILLGAVVLGFQSGISWAAPSAQALYSESFMGGSWKYDYILYNTSDPLADAGYNIYDFFLKINVIPPATLTNILSPTSWDFNSDSSSFIDWYSLLPGVPPGGADIAPGTSLSGFSLKSDTRLASLSFDVLLSNPTGGEPVPYSGNAAPIPEPTTLLLLGIGLAGLGYFRRRRLFK